MPVQWIEFIGVVLDSMQARAFLPQPHFKNMSGLIARLRVYLLTRDRSCLQLLGHMVACKVHCKVRTPKAQAVTNMAGIAVCSEQTLSGLSDHNTSPHPVLSGLVARPPAK